MIDDENDPEYKAVVNALFEQAATLANMRGWTPQMFIDVQALCDDAVRKAKQHGVLLPDMIVAWFHPSCVLRIFRREATHEHIQNYAINLIRGCPDMSAQEIAEGFRRAYPSYKPSDPLMKTMMKRCKPMTSQ